MKTFLSLILLLGLGSTLTAQPETTIAQDRGMLVVTYLEGAQLLELSTTYSFRAYAIYDETQSSSSTRDFVRNTPYYDWQSVSLSGLSDNRYVLQQLQQLEANGWKISGTDFGTIPPNFDYSVSVVRNLIYHLERPPQPRELVREFSGQLDNNPTQFRIQVWQQAGVQLLTLERQLADQRWQNVVTTDQLLPQPGQDAETEYSFDFTGQFIELSLLIDQEHPPSNMRYRFSLVDGQFALTEIKKRVGAPCGAFEEATYRPLTGSISIVPGRENCSVNEGTTLSFDGLSFNGNAARLEGLSLGNFQPGSQRIRISGNRGDFIF